MQRFGAVVYRPWVLAEALKASVVRHADQEKGASFWSVLQDTFSVTD